MSREVLVSCSRQAKAVPYVGALRAVGFEADEIRVVPADTVPAADGARLGATADALLLCGGPDLDPSIYGEKPHPNADLEVVAERDALEMELLKGAREATTPVFGVCRGMQVLNAFLGGTLWQDLRLMWPGSLLHALSYPRDALVHHLNVTAPDSELGRILEREVSLVNSRHHQAVKGLAEALEPIAWAPDGVLEAVDGRLDDWWLSAVQWHPENLVSLSSQLALFQRFHDAVGAASRSPARAAG